MTRPGLTRKVEQASSLSQEAGDVLGDRDRLKACPTSGRARAGLLGRWVGALIGLGLALWPHTLPACAACFGQKDSRMADGLAVGVLSLFAVVALVLGGIAAFFVHLGRRAAAASQTPPVAPSTQD